LGKELTEPGERDRVVLQKSAQRERDYDDAESLLQSRGVRRDATQARRDRLSAVGDYQHRHGRAHGVRERQERAVRVVRRCGDGGQDPTRRKASRSARESCRARSCRDLFGLP
jgi:hypothetical protein